MLVYLASPYTAPTAEEREQRFLKVCRAAAELMLQDYEVFCPIAHSHPIEVHGMDTIKDGDFWLKQDFAILKHCNLMAVYTLPGWKESKGIAREIQFATDNKIPVIFIEDNPEYVTEGNDNITNAVATVHPLEPVREVLGRPQAA